MILKEKSIRHQFISGIYYAGNLLACIDPIYRHGKPLKFQMDSRQMILALCDGGSLSNIGFKTIPTTINIGTLECSQPLDFKLNRVELIPLFAVQRPDIHFTYRPFIEFNKIDTFASIAEPQPDIPQWTPASLERLSSLDPYLQETVQPVDDLDAFNFEEFLSFLQ